MNRIAVTIREANVCSVKAWLVELDAFHGAVVLDELADDAAPETVAAVRKAIAAHEDAVLLLKAALPTGR